MTTNNNVTPEFREEFIQRFEHFYEIVLSLIKATHKNKNIKKAEGMGLILELLNAYVDIPNNSKNSYNYDLD